MVYIGGMTLPTLYKISSTGATISWAIEYHNGAFRTISGQVPGVQTTTQWTKCFGKNIGKSNETSDELQAELEAKAKHKKKKDEKYIENIDELTSTENPFYSPMLAHSFDKYCEKIKYPVFVQPKLDGVRALFSLEGGAIVGRTRKGKTLPERVVKYIGRNLVDFFAANPDNVLDGELYNHDFKDNFNAIISLVRKESGDDSDEALKHLQYWIYDTFSPIETDYMRRTSNLINYFSEESPIVLVGTELADSFEKVTQFHDYYVSGGYEGAMVRNIGAKYENKRSKSLLKVKTFEDNEYILVRVEEGRGNRAGIATRAVGKLKDGREFEAGIIGNEDYARNLLETFNGEVIATFKHQGLTPDGVPRFAKLKIVRNYE